MNARLRLLGPAGNRLAFGPRPLPRLGYAFLFLLLLAALLLDWNPAVDLAAPRLPLTAFYYLLMAGALAGTLFSHRTVFDRDGAAAVRETRLGSLTLASVALPLPRNAEVRVRREGQGAGRSYVLEAAGEGAAVRIEAGPLRSTLEPPGREIAGFLGVPFRSGEE